MTEAAGFPGHAMVPRAHCGSADTQIADELFLLPPELSVTPHLTTSSRQHQARGGKIF